MSSFIGTSNDGYENYDVKELRHLI